MIHRVNAVRDRLVNSFTFIYVMVEAEGHSLNESVVNVKMILVISLTNSMKVNDRELIY